MNTLWPMGEGTVRDIRDRLAVRLPRAYTTIMTIMDRLARKGVVERRKVNRAYVYRPNLSAEQARAQALGQVLENFFGGSKEALLAQLESGVSTNRGYVGPGARVSGTAESEFESDEMATSASAGYASVSAPPAAPQEGDRSKLL